MERLKITADVREVGKKGANRRIRKAGFIPAVLYGGGEEGIGLKVNSREFTAKMKGVAGTNVLIDLEFGGLPEPVVVMLKDFQTDTLTRALTHIDLLRVNLEEKVMVKVPLHFSGKSVGVTKGGLIEQARRELEVRCLPNNIPDVIDVDITHLDVGHSLHLRDLQLPEGIELPHGADFTIVSIVAPREEVAPVAAPEVAAGAPVAEGAAPTAAAEATPPKAEKKAEKKRERKVEKKGDVR